MYPEYYTCETDYRILSLCHNCLSFSLSLSVAAGGSIPHSFQNAQKQQYLTNYMWCVNTLNDDVFGIHVALSLIIFFFHFCVAIGRLRVEGGAGQPLTSRPT